MPEVVEVHRRWHHLRVDDDGITIGWMHRRDLIPWSEVGALAVDTPISVLLLLPRWHQLAPLLQSPCLNVCVLHDGRPRPARAVRFRRRGLHSQRATEREIARLRILLADWIDLHDVMCQFGLDAGAWWYLQPGARTLTAEKAPREPTVVERAARLHGAMQEMQSELDHLREGYESSD